MSSQTPNRVGCSVDLVLPAHNEGARITDVLHSFYQQCVETDGIDLRIIVTEDGSSDDTAALVLKAAESMPITLIHTDYRKGYSRAVVDGLRAATAPIVVACDGDGQYDPADLKRLVHATERSELVVGFRNPRADPLVRRVMSAFFRAAYSLIQGGRFRDPSCPFVAFTRPALQTIVLDNPRVPFMPQGLWWEITARAAALGVTTTELPVSHLARDEGGSVVYRPGRIPRIVADNLFGLWLVKGDVEQQLRERD